MASNTLPDDVLTAQILDLFAREARVDRSLLLADARADQLGVSSLDLTLALFELEDHFDIQLPDLMAGSSQPTVGALVQQVLDAIRQRGAKDADAGPAATLSSAGQ
jgi:acyl carrier protein